MTFNWDIFIKIILSLILGGIIGIEREWRNQPAGFRTHIILCLGSTLIMMVSIFVAEKFGGGNNDPGRIAAQVVSGIGFLGAGAIFRFGASIKGLTTAASLWTTAAVGLAIGCGFYSGAILVVALMLVVLNLLAGVERRWIGSKAKKTLIISARDEAEVITKIMNLLAENKVECKYINIAKSPVEHTVEIIAAISFPPNVNRDRLIASIESLEGIKEIELS